MTETGLRWFFPPPQPAGLVAVPVADLFGRRPVVIQVSCWASSGIYIGAEYIPLWGFMQFSHTRIKIHLGVYWSRPWTQESEYTSSGDSQPAASVTPEVRRLVSTLSVVTSTPVLNLSPHVFEESDI